jgi:hypothetical protein
VATDGRCLLSDEPRRVPVVREVAIVADSFALVGGFPAWFLGRVLAGYPGGLERLLARSGIPSERREYVLRAVGALIHVGTAWRLEQESGSASIRPLGQYGRPSGASICRGSLAVRCCRRLLRAHGDDAARAWRRGLPRCARRRQSRRARDLRVRCSGWVRVRAPRVLLGASLGGRRRCPDGYDNQSCRRSRAQASSAGTAGTPRACDTG